MWNTGSKLNEEREKENGGETANKSAAAAASTATVAATSDAVATEGINTQSTTSTVSAVGGATSTGVSKLLNGELFTVKGGDDDLAEVNLCLCIVGIG